MRSFRGILCCQDSKSKAIGLLSALLLFMSLIPAAEAQEYAVGSYSAFIGAEDLANSRGVRLTDAVQVLRQDRANVHRFGIIHVGDESDPWFFQPAARAAMEGMFRAGGGIDRQDARLILGGNVSVVVTIFAVNGNFTSLQVHVAGAPRAMMRSDQGIVPPRPGPNPNMGCLVQGLDPNGDGFLAVRAGPGTQYRQIGELRNGDAAYLGAYCQGRWCYVEGGAIDGREVDFRGWIFDRWCMFYP